MYLSNYANAHSFTRVNGKMIYNGTNSSASAFFSNYDILEYYQSFPDGIDPAVLNIFYLETYSDKLANDLKVNYPLIYLNSDDITNLKIESLVDYYPSDYGTTSPVANYGLAISRKELDYLHVPKAWGITQGGNSNIKIGISDIGGMRLNATEFIDKTENVIGSPLNTSGYSHANDVAFFAAARGNNITNIENGSVGVCFNCSLISSNNGIGSQTVLSNLYKMAKLGAKVINMSWKEGNYYNSGYGFLPASQIVINDMVNNYKVTLVAAAGNEPSGSTPQSYFGQYVSPGVNNSTPRTPFGTIYVFPASYDNVISVSTINHRFTYSTPLSNVLDPINNPSYCCTSPWFPIHTQMEDSVSQCVSSLDPNNPVGVLRNGYYIDQYNPDGLQTNHTLNEKVDILSTGYNLFSYGTYLANGSITYTSGTSYSAPIVSGAIGLMLSVNDCLLPSEIESILKLTTKDIEVLPINQIYSGNVGAGKLEVGDAVEFVNEMKKVNGLAVIDNHIFNRFDFNLLKINNNLKIENVTLRDNCKANFKARTQINLKPGTNLKPNNIGYVYLGINPNIDITCMPVIFPRYSNSTNSNSDKSNSKVLLYPNPNKGVFEIAINDVTQFQNKNIAITIFDVNGRVIYNENVDTNVNSGNSIPLNVPTISSGIYFVKLTSNDYEETLKFIKK